MRISVRGMTLVSLRGHTEPILALGMIAPDKEDILSEHDILYSCALVCVSERERARARARARDRESEREREWDRERDRDRECVYI